MESKVLVIRCYIFSCNIVSRIKSVYEAEGCVCHELNADGKSIESLYFNLLEKSHLENVE
jgi:hypothetical protein